MLRAFTLAAVFVISGCAHVTRTLDGSPSSEQIRGSGNVVNVTGLGEVRIGLNRADLAGSLNADLPGCHIQLRAHPQASLVFTPEGRLVLMWFNAPLRTAEGIGTGASLDALRAAYPKATEVRAPQASHRLDGLLVSSGDYGYLFLHDGRTVQKAIAGYVEYLHRLFDSGFGVC